MWIAGLLIAAGRLAFDGFWFARANGQWLFANLPDDAYFYLEIAQRIARGEGSTIDGIHRTNGYHPLWQGILSALALVWHGDALTRAALITGLLLFAGAVLLMALLVRRWLGDIAGAVAAVAATTIAFPLDNGMETPATALLLAVVASAVAAYLRRASARRAVFLGLACGGLVLARVDTAEAVWLVPVVVLVVAWRWWPGLRDMRLMAAHAGLMAFGAVAVAGPWFGYSWATFGSPLPVSGAVKVFEANEYITASFGGRFTAGYARQTAGNLKPLALGTWYRIVPWWGGVERLAFTAGIVLLLVGLAWRFGACVRSRRANGRAATPVEPPGTPGFRPWRLRHPWSDRAELHPGTAPAAPGSTPRAAAATGLLVVAVVVGVQLLVSVVVIPGDWIELWYSAPWYLWAATLGAGAVAAALWAATRRRAVAMVLCVALLAAWSFARLGLRWNTDAPIRDVSASANGAHYESARWIAAHAPAGVFASYSSGYAAFVADPTPLVNMDGLANSYDYLRFLRQRPSQVELYRWSGARYLVTEDAFGRVPPCATQLWRAAGVVHVPPDPATGQQGRTVPLGVFDLTACGLPGPHG